MQYILRVLLIQKAPDDRGLTSKQNGLCLLNIFFKLMLTTEFQYVNLSLLIQWHKRNGKQ